jgi:hypothetical protein
MPDWTFWAIIAVFGVYLAWYAVRQAVKVRRVWRHERALTEEARRR